MMDIAIAQFFFQFHVSGKFSRMAGVTVKAIVLILSICAMLYAAAPLSSDWSEDFHRVRAEMRQHIPSDEPVMANQLWWFAAPDQTWVFA